MRKSSSASAMKGKQRRKSVGGVSTDEVLCKVYNALISDFQRDLSTKDLNRFRIKCVADVRKNSLPTYRHMKPNVVKRFYQLDKFFSRYTSKHDLLSRKMVKLLTIAAFERDNNEIAKLPSYGSQTVHAVLQGARRHASRILGEYSEDEHLLYCRFGKRAALGIPYSDSYLERKMSYPISSASPMRRLFDKSMTMDPVMQSVFAETNDGFTEITEYGTLKLSNVPKKYDKDRMITPYTTVETFLSLGLGEVLRLRLKDEGLDVTRLQNIHRKLVGGMSKNRRLVTADMSAASNRITTQLVGRIIPRSWYRVMKLFHARYLMHNDYPTTVYRTETFAMMGCGFTFPLQTLIFYCLLRAIADLSVTPGRISVYSDDLIYPRPMHKYVENIFPRLGLKINNDKTFVEEYFRESCGEDACHGVSVRPFSYEGQTEFLRKAKLSAFLYKILNGLLARWPERDITTAVHTLKCYLSASTGIVHLVPPSFPETSGYRTADPQSYEWFIPYSVPYIKVRNWIRSWVFTCITSVSGDRPVVRQYPYYWDALRVASLGREVDLYAEPEDSFSLKWIEQKNRSIRLKGGRKVRRLEAFVSRKQTARETHRLCVVPETKGKGLTALRINRSLRIESNTDQESAWY